MVKTLYIIRGVPGSGKSTLAHKLTDNVVEADQFMYVNGEYKWSPNKLNYAHSKCKRTVEDYMIEGRDTIAVANTFIKRKEVQPYIELAEEYGYKVVQKVCKGDYQSIHNVPQETIEKMRKRLQESLKNEVLEEQILDEDIGYHGSPYDFDEFDTAFMGSGEGAQVHGWGLYFALNPDTVVKRYTQRLTTRRDGYSAYVLGNHTFSKGTQGYEIMNILSNVGSKEAIDHIKDMINAKKDMNSEQSQEYMKKLEKMEDFVKSLNEDDIDKIELRVGQQYVVELPESSSLLNEDKPMSTQPDNVKKAFKEFAKEYPDFKFIDNQNGENAYVNAAKMLPGKYFGEQAKAMSLWLRDHGVPGILYFGYEDGKCCVIFSGKDVKIVGKHTHPENKDNDYQVDSSVIYMYPDDVKNIENPSLEFQKEVMKYHPTWFSYINNPADEIKEIAVQRYLTDENALSELLNENIKLDETGFRLTYMLRDLEKVYDESGRETLSLDTIGSILSGDSFEIFDNNYYNGEHFADLPDMDIFETATGMSAEELEELVEGYYPDDLPSEACRQIQEMVEVDFGGEGIGLIETYNRCYIDGSEAEAYKDVLSSLEEHLPLDPKNPLTDDWDFNIFVPMNELKELVLALISIPEDEYDDETDNWLSQWHCLKFGKYEYQFSIYEPRYGWYGFDEEDWCRQLQIFSKNVKQILDNASQNRSQSVNTTVNQNIQQGLTNNASQNVSQTDEINAGINEVLRIAGVKD